MVILMNRPFHIPCHCHAFPWPHAFLLSRRCEERYLSAMEETVPRLSCRPDAERRSEAAAINAENRQSRGRW